MFVLPISICVNRANRQSDGPRATAFALMTHVLITNLHLWNDKLTACSKSPDMPMLNSSCVGATPRSLPAGVGEQTISELAIEIRSIHTHSLGHLLPACHETVEALGARRVIRHPYCHEPGQPEVRALRGNVARQRHCL